MRSRGRESVSESNPGTGGRDWAPEAPEMADSDSVEDTFFRDLGSGGGKIFSLGFDGIDSESSELNFRDISR